MTFRQLGAAAATLAALALFTALDARPAQAQRSWASPFPWCAYLSGSWGGVLECSYHSQAQCLEFVSGVGGGCSPNPAYTAPPEEYVPVRKPRRRAQ